MKTTIDIADGLLARAKEIAHREDTTLRALVEEGLDAALRRRAKPISVRVKPVVVNGHGLTPEFQNASWEKIRDAIYEGHGA